MADSFGWVFLLKNQFEFCLIFTSALTSVYNRFPPQNLHCSFGFLFLNELDMVSDVAIITLFRYISGAKTNAAHAVLNDFRLVLYKTK